MSGLQKSRHYISSSIENWRDKIKNRYEFGEFDQESKDECIFFGLYNENDYKRCLDYSGLKKVLWCGSDIIHLRQRENTEWPGLFAKITDNICENEVEQKALEELGIKARVQYNFLSDVNKYYISFKPSQTPHVWLCYHKGYEKEYGIDVLEKISKEVPEISFHVYEGISEYKLDREIKDYQCGLRLNEFDGFSEVLSKSILMGQYPISRIKYPHMDCYETEEELISLLKNLKNKLVPNPNRDWWLNELKKDL